ncbi:MAG: hypothetical protein AAF235_06705 [Planctomycetota bacterium]
MLYRDDLIDLQDVLSVQMEQLCAEGQVAEAAGLATQNLVGLYKAMGGGWDPDGDTLPADEATRPDSVDVQDGTGSGSDELSLDLGTTPPGSPHRNRRSASCLRTSRPEPDYPVYTGSGLALAHSAKPARSGTHRTLSDPDAAGPLCSRSLCPDTPPPIVVQGFMHAAGTNPRARSRSPRSAPLL